METRTSFADNVGQALGFSRQNAASYIREAIVASARIVIAGAAPEFFDPLVTDQLLQVVIKRARSDLVLASGMAGNFLHDAVAVKVLAGERKQDVEGGRREWQGAMERILHNSESVISESELYVNRKNHSGMRRGKAGARQPLRVSRVAVIDGVEDEFDSSGDPKFFKDAKEIFLDGVLAEVEFNRDLAVAKAFSHERHDLLLARRKEITPGGVKDS